LREHDEQLSRLGVLAESYFANDPSTGLLKLRQFAETLAQFLAARSGLYQRPEEGKGETQYELLRRLQYRSILPCEIFFAYADRFDAYYKAARRYVEHLTPALLAKAFRGGLVPQDPNDEPASVLLERIKAKRNGESKPRTRAVKNSVGD
jgi:hypothetical protein